MTIERGQKVLVDTNILLEATDRGRRFHKQALSVFQQSADLGVDLHLGTQVVREYLVVCTRPVENNGLGMTLLEAVENIGRFRSRSTLIAETLRAGELFLNLATRFGIRGKRLHDLQLLATALAGGLDVVLTANEPDFPEVVGIRIVALSSWGS